MTAAPDILAIGPTGGGVGDVFRRAVEELRGRGFRVDARQIGSVGGHSEAAVAWRALREAWPALRSARIVHVELGSNDLAVMWFLVIASARRRDIVVVAHDVPRLATNPGAGLIRRSSRARTIVAHRLLQPILGPILRTIAIRRTGAWLALGDDAVMAWRSFVRGPVRRLHLGMDVDHDEGVPPSAGAHVLFAGFIGPSKGLDVLLDAWNAVALRGDPPLVVVGADDGAGWAAEQRRRTAHMAVSPHWMGPVEEPRFSALFRDAALVVLPYRSSSAASGILVRALAVGRPILGTRVPAVQSLVRDGVEGRIVDPGNAKALGQALRELLDDPDTRNRMGNAARTVAAGQLNWARHADDLEAGYRDAVGDL